MLRFFIFTILVLQCGCDGIIMNHYASRANEPIDGTYGNKRFNSKDVNYTQGNLEHLTDRKKRDNNLYYASAKKYNTMNYQIAKEYLGNYQKFLRVDAKELENGMKEEQYGVKGKDLVRKMEAGILPVYPLRGNIEEMQILKDEYNKIAFPDYMDEYLNVYKNNDEDKVVVANADYDDTQYFAEYSVRSRDDYIYRYLGAFNEDGIMDKKVYKEAPLS